MRPDVPRAGELGTKPGPDPVLGATSVKGAALPAPDTTATAQAATRTSASAPLLDDIARSPETPPPEDEGRVVASTR